MGPAGEPILLFDQNRAHWDQLLIRRGLTALERAEKLGGVRRPYALQAAIAACHAKARTPEETDWARIVNLYAELAQLMPSPAGDDWMRPALCEDALRLGRILAELAPSEPEVHGLVALMEIQASRS